MQAVEDKMETIHLYVVKEEPPRPSLLPIVLSVLSRFVVRAPRAALGWSAARALVIPAPDDQSPPLSRALSGLLN